MLSIWKKRLFVKTKLNLIFISEQIYSQVVYIGQSIDLSKRFWKYFTLSYLKSKKSLIISRALVKYGYIHFSLSILEYCDKSLLLEREQHYGKTHNEKSI